MEHMSSSQMLARPNAYVPGTRSLVWKFPENVPLSLTLFGNSWACDKTAFQIPELGISLDAGFIAHPQFRNYIFITHCHGDHSSMLHNMVSRHRPPYMYIPQEGMQLTKNWLESWIMHRLMLPSAEGLMKSYDLNGVRGSDTFQLPKSKTLWCKVYECDHSVPCTGYGFYEVRKKLKPEYASLSGKDIGALRKAGTDVTNMVNVPIFVFLGDTTVNVFNHPDNSDLLTYPVIIVECSFLVDEDIERAAKTKHMHWSDLKPIVESAPNRIFVLIHFSHRYTPDFIVQFFKDENLPNVMPWIQADDATELKLVEEQESTDE